MNLNCLNARSHAHAESELEAASKLVENAFNKIQISDKKKEQVEQAIKDSRVQQTSEMSTHLEWLLQQKARLEKELGVIDDKLAEKRLLLKERSAI